MPWHPYRNVATIGTTGSEGGRIHADLEHPGGARITIEQGGSAPWSITCGIYGGMVHTRWFGDRAVAEAEFHRMQPALEELLAAGDDADYDAFIERFPT